jgi:hypothetical protein
MTINPKSISQRSRLLRRGYWPASSERCTTTRSLYSGTIEHYLILEPDCTPASAVQLSLMGITYRGWAVRVAPTILVGACNIAWSSPLAPFIYVHWIITRGCWRRSEQRRFVILWYVLLSACVVIRLTNPRKWPSTRTQNIQGPRYYASDLSVSNFVDETLSVVLGLFALAQPSFHLTRFDTPKRADGLRSYVQWV